MLSAGASAYILHALLSYLPLCFTIGARAFSHAERSLLLEACLCLINL